VNEWRWRSVVTMSLTGTARRCTAVPVQREATPHSATTKGQRDVTYRRGRWAAGFSARGVHTAGREDRERGGGVRGRVTAAGRLRRQGWLA